MARAITPPNASISLTKCPLPIPPIAGLQDICPKVSILWLNNKVCAHIRARHGRGRLFSIVVVSEGAVPTDGPASLHSGEVDEFGHERLGGIAVMLEQEIEARTGYETRMVILGHVQRGGTPTAFDRVLATRMGVVAIDAVSAGRFGVMASLRGTAVTTVPLSEALAAPKLLSPELYETAEVFFG